MAWSTAGSAKPRPHPLERPTHRKISKGRIPIDAKLDLHDLSQIEAHRFLLLFLQRAHADGLRHVLVITGKGSDAEPRFGEVAPGVLRREAPRWLATPPLSQMIVNVSQAHDRHGGGGALYVYLKRKR